ncbi:MAG: ABC transporter substrate-binding protein [Actinomycetota bacterium]
MRKVNTFRRLVGTGLTVGAIAISLAASTVATAAVASHVDHVPKDQLVVPMGTNSHANFIFPYASGAYFTTTNMNAFQAYMYRPLYWVGKGADITIQADLSLAALPVYSNGNKTVTVNMKGWKFSNGETIDAQSVKFFLNMYQAVSYRYAGYVPGFGIPDQVSQVTASGNVLTLTTTVPVNPNWFNYNFMTEITPFPRAWDIRYVTPNSKAASDDAQTTPQTEAAGCGTANFAVMSSLINTCGYYPASTAPAYGLPALNSLSVYTGAYGYLYYNSRPASAAALAAYATNPIWKVVSGPWKLKTFSATGNIVYVPNTAYSGAQKAHFATFTQVAETSTATEIAQLEAGQLDTGGVLPSDVTPSPKLGVAGKNLLKQLDGYTLRTGGTWAFYYAYYNFNSKSSGTALPNQLYIRQALQYGVDQVNLVKKLYNGYGVPGYGPIPTFPVNAFSGGLVNHYPFNPKAGIALLQAHGWNTNVYPAACVTPAKCGAGIAKGDLLKLTYKYGSGSPTQDAQMAIETSAWTSMGFKIDLSTDISTNIANLCTSGAGSAPTSGNPQGNGDWQICQYGGWLYAPDYYPSGELLFYTGALSNPGMYSDAKMDKLIDATVSAGAKLNAANDYAQYAMDQLPYLYQPTGTGCGEVSNTLKGVLPPSPTDSSLPEFLSK